MESNTIPTRNKHVVAWVGQIAQLCEPDNIYWCDGSDTEYAKLAEELVQKGTFIKLNEKKRPN